MNEIQPSNIQYVLWSEDDDYADKSLLSRDEFASLINKIELKNDLLVYGNVVLYDGRHNTLLENYPNTLESHIKANRWYSTWFIDDNDDLWCRDDTYADGVNYYLVREFNTKDTQKILTIKTSLSLDLETFDSDLVFDHTNSVGPLLIEKLDFERNRSNEIEDTSQLVNGMDLTYITMLINQELKGVLNDYSYDLDVLHDRLIDCLDAWYDWDINNKDNTTTINSMKQFINEYDRMILAYLNEASHENILVKSEKGKEL